MNNIGIVDLSNLQFKWFFDDLNKDEFYDCDGTLGAWNPITPNTVYIKGINELSGIDLSTYKDEATKRIRTLQQNQQKTILKLSQLIYNFPTIMHELYHMFQFKTCPVGYIFMRLITIFTTIPYYLAGDNEDNKVTKFYKKIFWWDLEQQAELNGNNVKGFKEYIENLNSCFDTLSSPLFKTYKTAYKNCSYTHNKKTIQQATDILKIIKFKRRFK